VPPLVTIRRMTSEDLAAIDHWLRRPHMARWFLPETTAEAEMEKYRLRIEDAFSATIMCMVELEGDPIGWCQWYRWEDYPATAVCIGAHKGEIGADYAIGDPAAIGRGFGTAMIATLVDEVRLHYPRAGLVITPEADNWACRPEHCSVTPDATSCAARYATGRRSLGAVLRARASPLLPAHLPRRTNP
jgi:RimJ/RimL family protein N-acetyltransferase